MMKNKSHSPPTQEQVVFGYLSCSLPPGSILRPLQVSLYINGLPLVCTGRDVQLYADDTVIYVQRPKNKQRLNSVQQR